MLVTLCAVLGLLIGSFLNVVIARVPLDESVVRPGSRCPRCAEPIAARDNVPVLSWVVLRGRARCCGAPIAVRYPLVELATGGAFAAAAAWAGTPDARSPWVLPALLYLAALTVSLSVIDVDHQRLPYRMVRPAYPVAAVLLGGAAWAVGDRGPVIGMLAGGVAVWLLYRLLHLVYPPGMGYGDVRLSGVLGMYLGWFGWDRVGVGVFAGFLLGGLGGVLLMGLRRIGLKESIPYGPYLMAGTWVGLVAGGPVAGWYLHAAGL